jgi:GNAT superfamily N-acetyltransferase
MPVKIVSLSEEHLPAAAALLAQRQRRNREVSPELPVRFEQPAAAEAAIRAALSREHAAGFAALEDGRLLAYLIGDLVIDSVWGRSAWIRLAGCAYDADTGVEPVRDLYAALGERWVELGAFYHVALTPVCDPALVEAWFSLSFGIEQVFALQALEGRDLCRPTPPPGITLRQAGPDDAPLLAGMSDIIWRTQVKAPVWAVMMPEDVAGRTAGWSELAADQEVAVWLAMRGDEALAVQGCWAAEADADNVMLPGNCAHLSVAGTRAEARGEGLGVLLCEQILHEASVAGYRFIETDWRSANLFSSRFWPRRGFRPLFYRLVRRIDQRIAWADGSVQA